MAGTGGKAEAPAPAPFGGATLRRMIGASDRWSGSGGEKRRGTRQPAPVRLANAVAERTYAFLKPAVEIEIERGCLFLLIPVLLGIGALIYFNIPVEPDGLPLLAVMIAAGAGVLLSRRRYGAHLACCACCLVLGGFSAAKFETWRASTMMLGQEVTTRVTGRVVRMDGLPGGRMRYILDVMDTARPKLRYAPRRVRITGKPVAGAAAGATVTGLARLAPPSGPVMPGGYDFSFQSYFGGVGANGFFLGAPTLVAAPAADDLGFSDRIEAVRNSIAARIRAAIGGAEGEVAAALIVGVRGGIPEQVNEDLRRTGLAHILSISGVHMALVAASVIGAARGVLALFPIVSSRRAVKKYAAAVGLAAVSVYVLFSGADVTALRSYVMLAVMLVAMMFDRAALSMRNVAIAAIVVLLWSPHEIVGPSFQMSFAATAALIACYSMLSERGQRGSPRSTAGGWLSAFGSMMVRSTLALGATSIIAGAATAVFGIYHFQRFAPLSLPANLVVMPIVSVLVMPFAVIGTIAMAVGAEAPFLAVMDFGLRAMDAVASWFSRHSPIDAVGAVPMSTLLLTTAAIVLLSVTTTRLRFAAVPALLAVGLAAMSFTQPPTVLVSEDARLVGVLAAPGQLAVNVARGGGFTLESWERALVAKAQRPLSGGVGNSFRCADGLCRIEIADGRAVGIASNADAAKRACGAFDVLVYDAAGRMPACGTRRRGRVVITRSDLALRGAAALELAPGAAISDAKTVHAIAGTGRPWHLQRKFSRAARGLEEHRRADRRATAKRPAPASASRLHTPSTGGKSASADKHLRNTE